MTAVSTQACGAVLRVTIERPEAHNALNREVLQGLVRAIEGAEADPAVRAVVLTGRGTTAFSAGADLKEIAAMGPDEAADAIAAGQATMDRVAAADVPVVAAVDGLALGGGFELALAATFTVLSESASLGLPESGLGLIPGYGGTQRLPRAIGARTATYLMTTGTRLDARRAYELGLSPVAPVPSARLVDTAHEIADRIERELVGRNVLQGRWTFQVVEEYDDGYYATFKELDRFARDQLVGGKRHLYEAEMKEDRRTDGRPGHEATP